MAAPAGSGVVTAVAVSTGRQGRRRVGQFLVQGSIRAAPRVLGELRSNNGPKVPSDRPDTVHPYAMCWQVDLHGCILLAADARPQPEPQLADVTAPNGFFTFQAGYHKGEYHCHSVCWALRWAIALCFPIPSPVWLKLALPGVAMSSGRPRLASAPCMTVCRRRGRPCGSTSGACMTACLVGMQVTCTCGRRMWWWPLQ